MKFVHVTYHFEYDGALEEIFDAHDIEDYVRYPMMDGRDERGKHFGTQVHPGNVSVLQAQVPDEKLDEFMEDLKEFKESKEAHQHLQALVLPIERRL